MQEILFILRKKRAIELRSMVFTLGMAQIYSALHSLNQTIRHKSVQFIPNVWPFRQQFVILQRQTNKSK